LSARQVSHEKSRLDRGPPTAELRPLTKQVARDVTSVIGFAAAHLIWNMMASLTGVQSHLHGKRSMKNYDWTVVPFQRSSAP